MIGEIPAVDGKNANLFYYSVANTNCFCAYMDMRE